MKFLEKFELFFFKRYILKIAAKNGCDWDGDTLTFYVDRSRKMVVPVKLPLK